MRNKSLPCSDARDSLPTVHARGRRRNILLALGLILLAIAVSGAFVWDMVEGNAWFNFYGRVVDEHGNGMPGCMITLKITKSDFFSMPVLFVGGPMTHEFETNIVSDANGNFQLRFGHGSDIFVSHLRKAGYQFVTDERTPRGRLNSLNWTTFNTQAVGGPTALPSPDHPATYVLTRQQHE